MTAVQADPSPSSEDLARAAEWAITGLANAGSLDWLPTDNSTRPPVAHPRSDYSRIYEAMVECLPGIDPEPHTLMESYQPNLGIFYAPAGTVEDTTRFIRLYGKRPPERKTVGEQRWAFWKAACGEARALLFPERIAAAAAVQLVPQPVTGPKPDRKPKPPALVVVEAPPKIQATVTAPAAALPSPAAVSTIVLEPTPVRELNEQDFRIQGQSMVFTPVAQLQGVLLGSQTAEEIRAVTLQRVIGWLTTAKQVKVPTDWQERLSWEAGTDGAARQTWYESDGTHVAIRFDEPCGEVHGRSWRVEFVLTENDGHVLIGTRVSAMVQNGVAREIRPTVPMWVRRLTESYPFYVDNRAITSKPTSIGDEAALARMVELIRDRHRSSAVVVVPTHGARTKECAMATHLASRVAGAAHVFTLHAWLLPSLEAALGEAGRIAARGVRLYKREFDPSLAAVRCPVMSPRHWPSHLAVEQLAEACAAETVAIRDPVNDLPSFAQIRQLIVRERRRQERAAFAGLAETSSEDVRRLVSEREMIEADLAAAEDLASELQQQLTAATDDLRDKEAIIWMREQQIEQLKARIVAQDVTPEIIPQTWDEIVAWTANRYAGKFVLTSSAVRAAKRSVFEDLPFVCEVISLMAEDYWSMRVVGDEASRAAFNEQCLQLRVEESKVGVAVTHHRLRDQYRTTWNGRTYNLDAHIRGSSSRDRRRGFRLYFCWDESSKTVVCGSLPDHLDNGLT